MAMNVGTAKRPSQSAASGTSGPELFERLQPRFEQLGLAPDTVIIVNTQTSDFVVGQTLVDAIAAFEAKWGLGAPGYMRRMNGPFRG